jgi:hypothetical protein
MFLIENISFLDVCLTLITPKTLSAQMAGF